MGFTMPAVDREKVRKVYDQILKLTYYLRSLGDFKRRIVAKSIVEKVFDNSILPKLAREILENEKEKNNAKGILIHDHETWIYSIQNNELDCLKFTDGHLSACCSDRLGFYYVGNYFLEGTGLSEEESLIRQSVFISGFEAFLKYVPIETKILGPKKKDKLFGCKYLNETNSEIEIIDSTWFTNLIKSDAFKVRGHFRLQPKKKEGEWTKELIWINEFEKSGYTRKAKKDNQ